MALAIAPYTSDHDPAVRAFNQRLEQAGVSFRFPASEACADAADAPVANRGFVAVQDGDSVRGGYLVKEQDFWLNGRRARLGYLRLPLSEGLIDKRYSTLGVQLIAHAIKRQPLLFGLGIGSRDEAFARVVSALGWTLEPVPFFFKVLRPFRVARGLTAIRRTLARRAATELAAWTGLASVAAGLAQRRSRRVRPPSAPPLELVDGLDRWADQVWNQHRDEHRLVAWRDRAALRLMYPAGSRDYLKFVKSSARRVAGWAIALDTQMSAHKYFGDLRVGTIVDCFGDPRQASGLIGGVSHALAARGVDVVVTNQASDTWRDALHGNGFLSRPSNFFFAMSPALVRELGSPQGGLGSFHLTRGDGDGPINL